MTPFKSLEVNYDKILKLFGKDFLLLSHDDKLSTDEVIKANETLARYVYKEQAPIIASGNADLLEERHEEVAKKLIKHDLESELDLDQIGAILVRPEVYQDKEKYKEFLKKLKLDIIHEKKVRLDFERYWILYHEQMMQGLKENDSLTDFATRTFNYIDNDCYLYVVSPGRELVLPTSTVAEYLFKYKGSQGTYSKDTLRGDIAFKALDSYAISGTELKKEANIPLDPIGVYRALVRGEIHSDRCHEQADKPILFYGGQSVHIPNRDELQKDLNMFCNDEDIKKY